MADKEAIKALAVKIGDLPAMPSVVSEVLQLTNDPAVDMGDVSKAIQGDPALTAKILRVSNSSYYGMKQYVGTLKLALVILGVREVRNIVLGVSVFDTFNDRKCDARMAECIWDNSLLTGGLAKNLGEIMKLGLQGEEFVAGLLADIGKMALLRRLGTGYSSVLKKAERFPKQLLAAEKKAVGCTHADLAMALSEMWDLPKALSDALWYQYPEEEKPLADAEDPKLAAVVRIAKAAIFTDFSKPGKAAPLEDDEAWKVLESVKNPIPEAERKTVLADQLEALRNAPSLQL
jgi:HD-like signal output (HDOD) protein